MARKKLTFEESLDRLEEIVRKLEGGEPKLEEALLLYNESNELVKYCTKLLDDAEQKVTVIEEGEENRHG